MKYIIFSYEGTVFPLASHLQKEGYEVLVGQVENIQKTFTTFESSEAEKIEETQRRLRRYNGILEKVPADQLLARLPKIKNPQDYFVICESNTLFYYAEYAKKLGFHGQFPTKNNRLFEIDRNRAKEFVRQYYPNLKIAQKKQFNSISDAVKFLQKEKKVWVLKSHTDAVTTFVPNTDIPLLATKQIIENLNIYQSFYEASGFFLELKIPSVIEITPEKIYYDGVPLGMTVLIENKFIGSGNISFQVACAGDIVFPVSLESTIHDIAFPPIVDSLAKQHKGLFIWDASLLINEKTGDIYFGEFCPNRLGYNSSFTMFEQMSSVNDFYEKVIRKENPYKVGTIGTSLMLFNLLRDPDSQSIFSDLALQFPKTISHHLWLYDVYKKNGMYYTAGYDTHLSPITASKDTLEDSVDALYSYVSKFSMNSLYYRPKFDFLSTEYSTSIINRLKYCREKKLFDIPFPVDIPTFKT